MRFSVLAISTLLISSSAFANPMVMSEEELDSVVAGTTGYDIAGDLYGNISNPRGGTGPGVDPSWSPGPWVCDYDPGCDGPTDPGGSVGDFVAPAVSGGTASPTFANGNDQDIDFSAPHL